MPKGRRGYYKQPSSIWREGWPIEVIGSLSNLQAYLHDRWARDGIPDHEAGRAVISIANLEAITGTETPAQAVQRMSAVCQRVSIGMSVVDQRQTRRGTVVPTLVLIDWPKFARYQHNLGEFAREKPAKEGLRVPRIRVPRTAKKDSAKPSHEAIAIFAEEFKAARGQGPYVPDRDKRELGAALAGLGAERFRAAAKVFMGLQDKWIRDRSFNSRAFLQSITKCDLVAKDQVRVAAAHAEPDPAHGAPAEVTALFKRGGPGV